MTLASSAVTPEAARFLDAFFNAPNRLTIESIEAGRAPRAKELRLWIDRLRQQVPLPTVLPCWRGSNVLQWYGIAFSGRQMRTLSEDLLAFVGPSYSSFRGSPGELDPSDVIDAAVIEYTRGQAIKFAGPEGQTAGARLLDALELMRVVQDRRPAQVLSVPRATGRVLRDFFMALRAGDRANAESELSYLTREFRLDPLNILFLRVQALVELGEWGELLRLPDLQDLLQVRRPVAVTEAIIRAIYQHDLAHFEYTGDARGAAEYFRREVITRYPSLFVARAGLRGADVLKSFMLAAVAAPTPSPGLRDELFAIANRDAVDAAYLQQLADLLPASPIRTDAQSPAPLHPLTAAIDAEHRGDYESAFRLLANESDLSSEDDARRARVLLACAYELQTLESMRGALTAFDRLGSSDREVILRDRRYRAAYEWTRNQSAPPRAADRTPQNWLDWLSAVERNPAWPQALRVARQGALEWSIAEFLDGGEGPGRFAERVHLLRDASLVHEALPQFVSFFHSDPEWPRRELVAVYRSLLELLVFSTTGGEDDLTVFLQLAEGVLRLGATADHYAELIQWVVYLLGQYPSLHAVDWALDMLDLMAVHVAPSPTLRVNILAAVTSLFQRFPRQVDSAQRAFFSRIARELGHPEFASAIPTVPGEAGPSAAEHAEPSDALETLGGKTVAIYTLTESAGQRLRDQIIAASPTATVQLSRDMVGSQRLKQLSENADIFIVATASATHAATGFIQSHRRRDGATIRPAGKGTASMLRALREFLRQTARPPQPAEA